MSSLEFNKIAGAVLGTLTLTLGLSIFAEELFKQHAPEKPGYELPGEVAVSSGPKEPEIPLAELIAKGSTEKGQAIFAKCKGCHTIEKGGPNGTGPNLFGVIGGPVAHKADFAYSDPFKKLHEEGKTWTPDVFVAFVKNPKADIPNTKMGFIGLEKAQDRANILLYLNSQSEKPVDLPKS